MKDSKNKKGIKKFAKMMVLGAGAIAALTVVNPQKDEANARPGFFSRMFSVFSRSTASAPKVKVDKNAKVSSPQTVWEQQQKNQKSHSVLPESAFSTSPQKFTTGDIASKVNKGGAGETSKRGISTAVKEQGITGRKQETKLKSGYSSSDAFTAREQSNQRAFERRANGENRKGFGN